MAKKNQNNYFQMMKEMVACSVEAAEALHDALQNFQVEGLQDRLDILHEIEHRGDTLRHNLIGKLAKEFITPIELPDIMSIASQIDDVTDSIEDVLLKIHMFNTQAIPDTAIEFSEIIAQCARELVTVFGEFEHFKKSKTLHDSLITINQLEEQGDALYLQGVRSLYVADQDPLVVIRWTEIYNCLEKCCDTCEHTADLVEYVIMKNT